MIAIWTTIGKAIYWTLGGIQAAGKAIDAGRKLTRKLRRRAAGIDDTQPIPLTHRDVERRAQQIRCASRPIGSKPPPGC